MSRLLLRLSLGCVAGARILFFPVVADAQVRRAMSITDLLTAIRVGDPQVSPDGSRVLFVRTTTDLSSGKRNADIWTVPADGSAAGFSMGPAWAADQL